LLFLPKLKTPIKIELHREIVGKIKSITIAKSASNKFFVCILVEKEVEELERVDKIVGIDVGLKTFAVIATTSLKEAKTKPLDELKIVHSKISNPKYLLKAEKHLKRLQKALEKKQHKKNKKDTTKASKNYIKACKRISKLHEFVANQRKDFLQKATSKLINESQIIGLEDLNIAGMKKNHHLAKAISDVGWGYFRTFLTYKANWYGRRIVKADRFFASSKKCSTLGCTYVKKDLKLSERAWTCPICGHLHDRDENSADNLLYSTIKELNVPSERRNRRRKLPRKPGEIKTSGFVLEKVQNQVLSVKQEASKRSSIPVQAASRSSSL
jgi:putative transposase